MHVYPCQERIVYGTPAHEALIARLADIENPRVLLLTSRSQRQAPHVQACVDALGRRLAGTFSAIGAHSPMPDVIAIVEQARAAQANVIVAIGGGSVIDAAKMARFCLWKNINTVDGLLALSPGPGLIDARAPDLPPMICVPTTLSGAEFSHVVGITDPLRGVKMVLSDPWLIPPVVILDPLATLATPDRLWRASGIRAVDHCVETLLSPGSTPFSDAVAAKGLDLLFSGLRRGLIDADDPEARLQCQLGAWLSISGPAAGVPVGASHAIGRALGGAFGVMHGETSCILLPNVLRWNGAEANRPLADNAFFAGTRIDDPAAAIAGLIADLGLPSSLSDVGIRREQFGEIAEKAMPILSLPSSNGNCRAVETVQDVLEILEMAA